MYGRCQSDVVVLHPCLWQWLQRQEEEHWFSEVTVRIISESLIVCCKCWLIWRPAFSILRAINGWIIFSKYFGSSSSSDHTISGHAGSGHLGGHGRPPLVLVSVVGGGAWGTGLTGRHSVTVFIRRTEHTTWRTRTNINYSYQDLSLILIRYM